MPALDIPLLGNLLLCVILTSAAYTFAMALGAGRGRPRLLRAARLGTYATCAFVAVAILLLAYAFQTHDFRVRYISRYSDRSMPGWYLFASLWGGQDGSLLWWLTLLAGYTAACTRWLRGRLHELQPWILATLMSIFAFFVVLMLFAANPFATHVAAAPIDGEGLNPLLQNYWMMIHPPSLYMGFVGWAIPFAFVVAALMTGRLNDEWIKAARVWTLLTWTFLSIGLLLGCLWSYEELGWGGYWAWDPVENASFMPWLAGTAYLHSAMVQERYGMLKVWNVFLLCLTFIMTIFGTALTRSGLIASVHSFARSDIGLYFFAYIGVLAFVCLALVIWRLPKLRAEHRIESLLSREFFFLLNNWILLGMMVFVLCATMWPRISEWLQGAEATVGPPFYNQWMVPFGIILLFLTGVGPLVSWRKASGQNLLRAMLWPAVASVTVLLLQIAFGESLGFSAYVESDHIYDTATGVVLGGFHSVASAVTFAVSAFTLTCIGQEFWRGTRVRMRKGESFFTALFSLVSRARRRYGGYTVHIGVVVMFIGFAGAAYDVEAEAAVRPNGTLEVGDFQLRYERSQMLRDPNKRAVYSELTVLDKDGNELSTVYPAKFIYRTHPEMPTTEVSIRSRLLEDLYVIMSVVDPQTQRGTFRVIQRPLVAWIWIGGIFFILGCVIAMWPRTRDVLRRQARIAKTAALILLALLVAPHMASAQSDSSSSLHAGTVVISDPEERHLFSQLLCQCGSCQRLPLDTCGCSWAEDARRDLRMRMAGGETALDLIAGFRAQHGPAAISVPQDQGMDRALWAVPVVLIVLAAGTIIRTGYRWRRRGSDAGQGAESSSEGATDYDELLEEELRKMDS